MVGAYVPHADIVAHDDDDVRLFVLRRNRAGEQQEQWDHKGEETSGALHRSRPFECMIDR
jgi:hypothetical protein